MNSPIVHPDFYSGISGLQIPIPKYRFPEEFQSFSRLQYYATLFNSIEINSSFYKVPKGTTVGNWADSVGDHFCFTYKLWRDITHVKPFIVDEAKVETFMTSVNNAGAKSGCLLIQFPPGLKIGSLQEVDVLLGCVRKYDTSQRWRIAVEWRNNTWDDELAYEMLAEHQASMVIHDKTKSASPMLNMTTDFVYVRFHGPSGDYRGSYSHDFLAEYADYIKEWLHVGKTVYAYFNNTMGDAISNLESLNGLVRDNLLNS